MTVNIGLGRVGSHKMDPWTTVIVSDLYVQPARSHVSRRPYSTCYRHERNQIKTF